MAEYCEAYLTTAGLCTSGTKCCVSRDVYPDKIPADLRVPNVQLANISHINQSIRPTKPFVLTSTNVSRTKPTKLISNQPTKTQESLQGSIDNNNHASPRPCDGECVSGLFALFCDELDAEAYCPNEGSCCVSSESDANGSSKGTTPKPHVTVNFNFFLLIFKVIFTNLRSLDAQ